MIATKHGKCCKEIKVEVYSQRQLDMLIKKTGKKKKLKRCNLNSLEIHLTSTTANITYQEKNFFRLRNKFKEVIVKHIQNSKLFLCNFFMTTRLMTRKLKIDINTCNFYDFPLLGQ